MAIQSECGEPGCVSVCVCLCVCVCVCLCLCLCLCLCVSRPLCAMHKFRHYLTFQLAGAQKNKKTPREATPRNPQRGIAQEYACELDTNIPHKRACALVRARQEQASLHPLHQQALPPSPIPRAPPCSPPSLCTSIHSRTSLTSCLDEALRCKTDGGTVGWRARGGGEDGGGRGRWTVQKQMMV